MPKEEIIEKLNREIPLDNTDASNYDISTYLTEDQNIRKVTTLFEQEYLVPDDCKIITDKQNGNSYVLSYDGSSYKYDAIKLKD